MEKWFRDHQDHPYPNEDEKKKIAKEAGIREDQVSISSNRAPSLSLLSCSPRLCFLCVCIAHI